jgi:hypothetical protein
MVRLTTGEPFGACIFDARDLKLFYDQEQAMKPRNVHRRRCFSSWWVSGILLLSLGVLILVITQPRSARKQEAIPPSVLHPDPEWFKFPLSLPEKFSRRRGKKDAPDTVDLSSEQSFPASDPPGWIRQRV